jgi:hypothetical protein
VSSHFIIMFPHHDPCCIQSAISFRLSFRNPHRYQVKIFVKHKYLVDRRQSRSPALGTHPRQSPGALTARNHRCRTTLQIAGDHREYERFFSRQERYSPSHSIYAVGKERLRPFFAASG